MLVQLSCGRRAVETLSQTHAVERTIDAGTKFDLQLFLPAGHAAHVVATQQEIDISIDTTGHHLDTGEFGLEKLYLQGTGSG